MFMKVKDCMCNEIFYATTQNTVKDCANIMCDEHVGCVPVCDNDKNLVGLVTDRDIILRCIACDKDPKTTPITEIMTCNPCCCTTDADITEVENLMSKNQVKRIPVLENNKIVGILTLGDLAKNGKIDDKCVSNTLNNICGCDDKNAE